MKRKTFRGTPSDVGTLTTQERLDYGLAIHESIVELGTTGPIKPDDLTEMLDYAAERGLVGFDTETSGLDPFIDRIILVQVGDSERQYLIWWQNMTAAAKERLRIELYCNPEIAKAGFNLKFDMKMFLGNEGEAWRIARPVDCLLLEQMIHCGLTGDIGTTMFLTSLGQTAKRWLGLQMVKDEETRTGWERLVPGRWTGQTDEETAKLRVKRLYAADDVCIPPQIAMLQNPWIKEFGLGSRVRMEMQFLVELADMEMRGVAFDWEKWKQLADKDIQSLADARAELDLLFDVTVTYTVDMNGKVEVTRDKNYASSKELRNLINEWMWEHRQIDVIMTNDQFKRALIRTGMKPEFAEKLLEKKLVPNPDKPGANMQVGYPGMTDYLTGSAHVPNRWEMYSERLSDQAYICPDSDSKTLKLMKILHEADDDMIDPTMPTRVGLPPELVDPILKFREYNTKVARYGYSWEKLIHPVTGLLHTDTTQCAANTARLTTRPNFQNITADEVIRSCFIAGEGWKWLGADWSQIEPRIIAELSHSKAYMRIFWSERPGTKGFKYWCKNTVTEPLDLYGAIGADIGVLPKDAEKKSIAKLVHNQKGRKKSKIAVLGLGYGTGPPKFHIQYMLDMGTYAPRSESDALHEGFWNVAGEVKETLDKLSALADPKKSRRKVYHPLVDAEVTYSENLAGRKLFFAPDSRRWWTQGRNYPVQSLGADILKHAVIELMDVFRENGWEGGVILTAHDEILVRCRPEVAEAVAKEMERIMAEVGVRFCPHVPISASAIVSDWWTKD